MSRNLPDSKRRDKHFTLNLDDEDARYLQNLMKITKEKPTPILMRAMYKVYNKESIENDVLLNYSVFITREIQAKKEMIAQLNKELRELEEELERLDSLQDSTGEEGTE